MGILWASLGTCFVCAAWAEPGDTNASAPSAQAAPSGAATTPEKAAEIPAAPAVQAAPTLGEAAISNQVLRIVLRERTQVSLYNARGQQLYQGEFARGVATLPLKSIELGFVYVTLRKGAFEQTLRLLHNGK